MERNVWPVPGSSTEREPLRPTLALFRTVAESNRARARRRLPRARYFNTHYDAVDEVRHVEPSGDVRLPAGGLEKPLDPPAYSPPPYPALTLT